MQDRAAPLPRTIDPANAAVRALLRFPHYVRAANRTFFWHVPASRAWRTLLDNHTDDFGNHVAGAAHDHGIADAYVLAIELVFVVQGRVRNGHAANLHRLQHRDRR